MALGTILWVDDEIDSLHSHILFLKNKGYEVNAMTNGLDAIDFVKENQVDVVLLDETMPGISGLETLAKIKEANQHIPVVLITKNETENLMDEAIGRQITDYLIKPVNPNQVLLSLKKIIDNKRLVAETTTTAYQQQFRELFMALNATRIIMNGWICIKNWYTGNWKWKKVTARKCGKFFSPKNRKPIQSSSNLFQRIMQSGCSPKSTDAPIMCIPCCEIKYFRIWKKACPFFCAD